MTPLTIDCSPITIDDVIRVATQGQRVEIGTEAVEAMNRSRAVVERCLVSGDVVYGVTTGFGKLADHAIAPADVARLQRNLIRSHSSGAGSPLPEAVVRAMILLRVTSLARGYSGIRSSTVQSLVDMLNAGVAPVIPSKGSVGASGDLAPLAHLALVLIGEGEATIAGQLFPGAEALAYAGIEPVCLTAKEGLALINGTQLMTSLAALLTTRARNLLTVADIAGAMTIEAVRGTDRAFDPRIQELRPHPGQIASAARLRTLLAGSEIMTSHRVDTHRVQDPYSLRCMPQVHGAAADAVAFVETTVETEINSVTDNPLIFPDDDEIISGGNFHGEPLAIALDLLAIAIAELANISERRVEVMLDATGSELPSFLTSHSGVESGFMVAQYTAAALVSENKILAHPASVDSIPTSANQEDHVSMGATAGLKAVDVMDNSETVLAIELLCAAEGIDCRRPLRTSEPLEAVHALIRSEVPHLEEDRPLYHDIESIALMVRDGRVLAASTPSRA